jgi:hypothetical protein
MSYEDDRLNFGAGTVPSATLSRYLALLTRLELGVQAPPGQARVTVRELYVQTRRQLKALSACLELEGLE